MNKNLASPLRVTHLFLTLSLLAVLLAACQPAPATADPNIVMTAAFETAFAKVSIPTETPAPIASETPIPTATIPRTPACTYQQLIKHQRSKWKIFRAHMFLIPVSICKTNGIQIILHPELL